MYFYHPPNVGISPLQICTQLLLKNFQRLSSLHFNGPVMVMELSLFKNSSLNQTGICLLINSIYCSQGNSRSCLRSVLFSWGCAFPISTKHTIFQYPSWKWRFLICMEQWDSPLLQLGHSPALNTCWFITLFSPLCVIISPDERQIKCLDL